MLELSPGVGAIVVVQYKGGTDDVCLQQTSPGVSYRSCLGMDCYPFRGDFNQKLPLKWR